MTKSAILLCALLAACGPDVRRTGAATDYTVQRMPFIAQSPPYCEVDSRLAMWADCVERCLPRAQVRAVCHKNRELPTNYQLVGNSAEYAYIPTGVSCGDAPTFQVLVLSVENRTSDMLDGGSMGAWIADDLAGCDDPEAEVDILFYEKRPTQTFYTANPVKD